MQLRKREELLETVVTEREAGRNSAVGILERTYEGHAPNKHIDDFVELERAGLVVFDGAHVTLTLDGEAQALAVVRRHRLAERLLYDVLELGAEEMETNACEFEHVLSAEATESVCALLGHPPTCPHGKPIPPGACCSTYPKAVRPLVTRLAHLELGVPARIVFISPRFPDRIDRLAALGVIPGCVIRLHQHSPAYVIEVGETTIGLDAEVAAEIYVSRRIRALRPPPEP